MNIFFSVAFILATLALLWMFVGLLIPRQVGLPSRWFALCMFGLAFVVLAFILDFDASKPVDPKTEGAEWILLLLWAIISFVVGAVRGKFSEVISTENSLRARLRDPQSTADIAAGRQAKLDVAIKLPWEAKSKAVNITALQALVTVKLLQWKEKKAKRVATQTIGPAPNSSISADYRHDGSYDQSPQERFRAPGKPSARSGTSVFIEYLDMDGVVTKREVQNWSKTRLHIEGFCMLRRQVRTFRIDRIMSWGRWY